jgi:hypothetical protein
MTKVTRSAPRSLLLPITAPARPTQQSNVGVRTPPISIIYSQNCTIINGDQHNNASTVASDGNAKPPLTKEDLVDVVAAHHNATRKILKEAIQQRSDEIVPSAKRRKTSSNNFTAPGERTSKEMATPVDAAPGSSQKRSSIRATSFKIVAKQKTYVSHRGDGDYERSEEGRIIYGLEEMHGQLMDLGMGCQGVKENDVSRAVLAILEREDGSKRIYKFGRQKVDDGKNDADGASSSAVPYNFMPKADSSSQKRASPLLKKSIAADAVKEDAISSVPPASVGWGNTFALKLGEWRCTTCRIKNLKETGTCLSCGNIKESDGGKDKAATSTPAIASTMFFFDGSKVDGKKDNKPVTGGFTFTAHPSTTEKKDDKTHPH